MIRRKLSQSATSGESSTKVGGGQATPISKIMSLYIVVAAGRVGELFPFLKGVPLAKLLIAMAIMSLFLYPKKVASTRLWSVGLARASILFFALIVISLSFSFLRSMTYEVIVGSAAASLVALVLIFKGASNWPSVRVMLAGCALSTAVLVIHTVSGYAGRPTDVGGYDPNDLAFVLVALLPVTIVFAIVSSGWRRLFFAVLSMSSLLVVLLTESRGGLLGLLLVLFAFALRYPASSDGKLRSVTRIGLKTRLAALTVLFVVAWVSVPQTARDRLSTLLSPTSDYNITSKEEGRFLIWGRNLPLVLKRPWGYGAGSSEAVDGILAGGRYRVLHNMYLQVLVELGVLGLTLFLTTFVLAWRTLLDRKPLETKTAPPESASREVVLFSWALAVGLAAAAVSGFFLSLCYSNALWILFSLACVTAPAANARLWMTREAIATSNRK